MKSMPLVPICLLVAAISGCVDQVAAPEAPDEAVLDIQGKMGDVPFVLTMKWTATPMLAPGFPLGLSTFDGLCSVPSTWYLAYTVDGLATHMGQVTGEGSHCSVVQWGPSGEVLGGTASDSELRIVAADGSELEFESSGMIDSGGLADGGAWWLSEWFVLSGTGRFDGATGSGTQYGEFHGFGVPAPVTMEGVLSY